MALPSDRRLFAMCLVSAAVGLVSWRAFLAHLNGGVVLVIAIVVLALLLFVDGFVRQ